ncbi:hypothetical protein RN001_008182 [Aquatica leii]|uniref:Uncharacterized protein n=1 Tax=Aquatica leii TaxID=1421715 RepID=A0AAN7S9H9_9COLE|nr:hypothetical protein RN001_008182 [Aquatica leii]
MKFLRAIQGVMRIDKIRNEKIREELEVEPIMKNIKRQQLRWFEHLVRMEEERTTKRIWEARVQQKKGKGRPRKTWNKEKEEIYKRRWVDIEKREKNGKN